MLRTVRAVEYLTPLREGGSLPAIVAGDDDGMYVVKFRGAGQGPRALIAELITGEIARLIGLPVPEIVFVDLDEQLAKTDPDPEIRDLLKASAGLNIGLDYLPGSITFDPLVDGPVRADPSLASKILWLDAYTTNVDRTPRNTNLLVWHKRLWLIDHGASLYFHHNWDGYLERAPKPFAAIREHVLLPWANEVAAVDEQLAAAVTAEAIGAIVDLIPEQWLGDVEQFATPAAHRAAYREYLMRRLAAPRAWMEEAVRVRTASV